MEMSMRKRPRPQQLGNQQFNQDCSKRPRHKFHNARPQQFRNQQFNQASGNARPQQFRNQQLDRPYGNQPHYNAVSYGARLRAIPGAIYPSGIPGAIPSRTVNALPNGVVYGSVATVLSAFTSLLAQGESGGPFIQVLLNNLSVDMLADIVIANMEHLPSSRDPQAILYVRTNDPSYVQVKQEPVEVESRNISNPVVPLLPLPQVKHEPLEVEGRNISNRLVKQELVEVESTNISNRLVKQERVEVESINISNRLVKQEPVEVENMNISDRVVKREPVEVESINISNRVVPSLPLSRCSKSRVQLCGDQKTALCISSLVRILEKHKTITAAGGGELRSALLARLVAEITEFLKVLEKHILADYEAHKGHELGLHVLYQLYADQPTIYDQFLLSLAQGLREKRKSLGRLLNEVPEVSMTALKLVEELCIAVSSEHVTTGLTALWNLILQRPPLRDTCLKLVLKCTVHVSENTRGKAVRLVANKLYPLHYVAQSIEDFATVNFYLVVNHQSEREESHESPEVTNGDVVAPIDDEARSAKITEAPIDDEARTAKSTEALSLPRAQQSMALFFALCTKKHELFRQLFQVYGQAPEAVKQAIDKNIPTLVRTIGSSSQELLQLIADPPASSVNLVKQVQTILSTSRKQFPISTSRTTQL